MLKSAELRQERQALIVQARAAMDANNTETFDRLSKEIATKTADIQRHEGLEALEREGRADRAKPEIQLATQVPTSRSARIAARKALISSEEYADAFYANLRFISSRSEDCTPVTDAQRTVLDKAKEYRDLVVGTGSLGGYTVPQGFYNKLVEALKWFGGMFNCGATEVNTGSGNDLPVPTVNDTAQVGAILAEAAADSEVDASFGQTIMKAYKYTSNSVLLSFELLQDSAFDLESALAKWLGIRIARITNTHFTVGTGTSQPRGVVIDAHLGKTGLTGQTSTIIFDDLVDLLHSLDVAYRQNARWMFHDSTLQAIMKLKDSNGRPLWMPFQNPLAAGVPDTILGKPYVINNDVAQMATSAKSVLFGDFSNYFIRNVMDVQLFRVVDKYIEQGEVGFVAFKRQDGRLIDAGTHPIQYYANSAS